MEGKKPKPQECEQKENNSLGNTRFSVSKPDRAIVLKKASFETDNQLVFFSFVINGKQVNRHLTAESLFNLIHYSDYNLADAKTGKRLRPYVE